MDPLRGKARPPAFRVHEFLRRPSEAAYAAWAAHLLAWIAGMWFIFPVYCIGDTNGPVFDDRLLTIGETRYYRFHECHPVFGRFVVVTPLLLTGLLLTMVGLVNPRRGGIKGTMAVSCFVGAPLYVFIAFMGFGTIIAFPNILHVPMMIAICVSVYCDMTKLN